LGQHPSALPVQRLRQRVDPKDANCKFQRALEDALRKSSLDVGGSAGIGLDLTLEDWRERNHILLRDPKPSDRAAF